MNIMSKASAKILDEKSKAKPIRVLLIEDDNQMERLIRVWLANIKGSEFELVWVDLLRLGLDRLKEHEFDVTLLDLNLPDSLGLETVSKVKEVSPHMPIVVFTGTDSGMVGVEAVQRGAQDYLVKGQVSSNIVMRSIMNAIERKRIEMELHESKAQLQQHYDKISQATKKLISPKILDQLAQGHDGEGLRAEQLDIAIMFADIRGFTSISEQYPPELVVNLLNYLLGEMVVSVVEEDGTLDKFIGDGLMAIFGAPAKTDNDQLRAVRAAFKMQARVDIFNYHRLNYFPELRTLQDDIKIGIGLHSGLATVGFIGTTERHEYTAIGDCVNVAARLCSEAKGGEVLVSRPIAEALGEHGAVGDWQEIRLKGKARKTEVGSLKYVKL